MPIPEKPHHVVLPERFEPYERQPDSRFRVKLAFRIDFENGGHLEGAGFLLDIPGESIEPVRAAQIIVSSMNLLRADRVTLRSLSIVRRGEHDDA